MDGTTQDAGALCLEGLILRDGVGCFYEVPCLVIERYRVSVARAAELAAPEPPEVQGFGALPWAVSGGVYAPPLGERIDAGERGKESCHGHK